MLRNRRGTFAEEYAILLVVLVAASVVMGPYLRDSMRAMVRWIEILCNTIG